MVRTATPNDLDGIMGLVRARYAMVGPLFGQPLVEPDAYQVFEAMIKTDQSDILVAEDRGKVVGMICLQIGLSWMNAGYRSVQGMALRVHPEHAGQGFARRLLEAAVKWTRTHNITTLEVGAQVYQEGERVEDLYRSEGFTPSSRWYLKEVGR